MTGVQGFNWYPRFNAAAKKLVGLTVFVKCENGMPGVPAGANLAQDLIFRAPQEVGCPYVKDLGLHRWASVDITA
jgi:hypothetical protein